jgi:Zn-finger nucleic acid-binding protein
MSFESTLDFGAIGEQDVDVEFDYTPGCRGSWDEPGCEAEVTITSVKWRGLELISDLSADDIAALVEDGFDAIEDAGRQAAEDRAERMYDERQAA